MHYNTKPLQNKTAKEIEFITRDSVAECFIYRVGKRIMGRGTALNSAGSVRVHILNIHQNTMHYIININISIIQSLLHPVTRIRFLIVHLEYLEFLPRI